MATQDPFTQQIRVTSQLLSFCFLIESGAVCSLRTVPTFARFRLCLGIYFYLRTVFFSNLKKIRLCDQHKHKHKDSYDSAGWALGIPGPVLPPCRFPVVSRRSIPKLVGSSAGSICHSRPPSPRSPAGRSGGPPWRARSWCRSPDCRPPIPIGSGRRSGAGRPTLGRSYRDCTRRFAQNNSEWPVNWSWRGRRYLRPTNPCSQYVWPREINNWWIHFLLMRTWCQRMISRRCVKKNRWFNSRNSRQKSCACCQLTFWTSDIVRW